MRVLCLLFLCAVCSACSTVRVNERGQTTLAVSDSWQTNQGIIKAAESSGNYSVGIAAGNAELAARPDNAEARVALARLFTRTGQPQQALLILAPVKDKNAPDVLLEECRAELSRGNVKEAGEYLDQLGAVSLSGAARRERDKLAAVSRDLNGDHEAAQTVYRALLSEYDDAGVRYNYGRSLMASGNYSQAVSILLPLAEARELPQARLAAAAAMAKNNNPAGARNLLQGYLPENEIDRLLGKEGI